MTHSYRDNPQERARVKGKIEGLREALDIVADAQAQDHENTFLLK